MRTWESRAGEEMSLFSPSFCGVLLWCAASAESSKKSHGMQLELLYLVLPLVLHRGTRETLPRDIRTSIPSWANANGLLCLFLAERARALVSFTREALCFGGRHSLFSWNQTGIAANLSWKKSIEDYAKKSTLEVQECVRKATFLGKWFQKTGDAATVMAILGVRP